MYAILTYVFIVASVIMLFFTWGCRAKYTTPQHAKSVGKIHRNNIGWNKHNIDKNIYASCQQVYTRISELSFLTLYCVNQNNKQQFRRIGC